MRLSDLKRAVEDVILRPDQNTLATIQDRSTIAALDLCQSQDETSSVPSSEPSAATMNTCSCSSEAVPAQNPRQPPQLCASTSLDTIVNRPQPLFYRHSAGVSRRHSRVFANLHSKRKRSNSLTNYNKRKRNTRGRPAVDFESQGVSVSLPPSARQTPLRFGEEHVYSSLGSSESHSSVARSEDYSQDYVPEEDEALLSQVHVPSVIPTKSMNNDPFTTFRTQREEEEMDCD